MIHVVFGTNKLKLEMGRQYDENQNYKCYNDSFNFFNLIQCVVVRRYIGVINFVESNHNWVAGLGILHKMKSN